jgi:hypothetical protein
LSPDQEIKGQEPYTTTVLKNNPIPKPFTARPTTNIANFTLAHSKAAPIAKIRAPREIALGLPIEFARWPPKNEDVAAGIKIMDTIKPCTVDERKPKVVLNCGMVVMEPIVPVSRLPGKLVQQSGIIIRGKGFYPNRAPLTDITIDASTYLGMWRRRLNLLGDMIRISIFYCFR